MNNILEQLPSLRQQLPGAVDLNVMYDRSNSIRDSVAEVKFTLVLTIALVILVIFLFLRNLSATVIPSLALPLSIIGTFAAMYLLGYSVNNITLMALTLSVGFVVDDAIVMLENIVRHMEHGEKPLEAALLGAKEIGFTIVSMTLSLVAVFIPVLFMAGMIGRVLHEFAVTIAVAILISGFVSLSLTPMLASRFLNPHTKKQHGSLYNLMERFFEGWLALYEKNPELGTQLPAFNTFLDPGVDCCNPVALYPYPDWPLPSRRRRRSTGLYPGSTRGFFRGHEAQPGPAIRNHDPGP